MAPSKTRSIQEPIVEMAVGRMKFDSLKPVAFARSPRRGSARAYRHRRQRTNSGSLRQLRTSRLTPSDCVAMRFLL